MNFLQHRNTLANSKQEKFIPVAHWYEQLSFSLN